MSLSYFHVSFLFMTLQAEIALGKNNIEPPLVEIRNGKIEGTWKRSIEGRLYSAFEGIPYAKPPVGELRFKKPEPREPWSGIWKAHKQYKCPQVGYAGNSTYSGEEDCLYLDVFVPKIEVTRKMDVLVFIHGGAFSIGNSSSDINQKHLMDREWIVVSMNYRLGALGFLSTEDDVVPGNNGLKDQSLALMWIQENIANFGGNPSSVTLTGFSAGAGAAHLHYFSNKSRGLYHRGWSFSGTAFNPWSIVEKPLKKAQILAKSLGCDISCNKEMINCLRQRPASLIVKKSLENMFPFPPTPFCPFAPVIEYNSSDPFLRDHPYKLLKTKQVYDVPWVASIVAHDGFFVSASVADRLDVVEEKWTEVAKYILDFEYTVSSDESIVAQKIKEFYFSKNSKIEWENMDILIKLTTDRYFEVDSINVAQLQSKINKSPVYFSKFTYEGTNGWKQVNGTAHGDDMVYYFGHMVRKPMTEKELELKTISLDTLYSYVTTGIPVAKGKNWDPIGNKFMYLNITGPDIVQMEVKEDFTANLFWKNLNLLENENIYKLKEDEL